MLEEKDEQLEEETNDESQKELKDFDSIKVNSPEELQELLDKLAGSGVKGKKIKKIGLINRLFPNIFVNLLFYMVFIALITIALQGYLNLFTYDYVYKLIIFIIGFGIIDTLGRDLLYSKLPFVVITSFGLVILLLTAGSSIGLIYLIPGLEIRSFGIFALYIFILMVF
jgi:hypothetical protein